MLTFRQSAALAGLAMVAVVPLASISSTAPAQAQPISSMSCQTLWEERNEMYDNVGYCFKTKRARDFFGNDDCYITSQSKAYSELSKRERRRVKKIKAQERKKGC